MPNSLYSSDSFNLKSVKSHAQLTQTANNVRIISQNLSNATIKLNIKTIMVVTKPGDDHLIALTNTLLLWLLSNYPYLVVYVDRHLQKNLDVNLSGIHERQNGAEGGSQKDVQKNSQKDMVSEQLSSEKQRKHRSNSRIKFWTAKNFEEDENYSDIFDLIITLGGDGTVLFVSQLFQNIVPPTIAFSLGSLGFLTNFKFKNYRKILTKILRLKYVKTNLRLRLSCQIVEARTEKVVVSKNVLNEITIDRGPNPFLTNLAVYGNDSLITITQADGLCIATPTGSTAYSLAAGGSLVHPSVSAISVTPICPHTLSFRPIILPDSMELKVTIPAESRCQASWVSFDGKTRFELNKDYYVVISASEFYFPTVMNGNNEYFDSVSNNLNWNTRKLQKPLNFHDNYKTCKPSKRDDDPVTQPKKTPSPNGVPKGRGTTPGKASHVYLGFAKSSDEESDSNQHDDDAFDDDDGFGTQSFYAQGDASDTEGLSSSTHQQDGESSHESSHDDTDDDDDDVEEEEEEEEHHTFEDDDDDFIETPVIPFEDINEALEIFSDDEPHDNSHIQLPLPNNKSRSGSVGSFKKIRTNSFTNFNQVYRDKLQLDPAKLHNKINHLKINSSSGTNLGRASFKVSPSPVNTNFNSTNKLSNEKSSDSLSNTAPLKQALASTLPYPRRHQHSSLNNETTAPKSSPQEHRKQAGESIFELKSSVSNSSNESL